MELPTTNTLVWLVACFLYANFVGCLPSAEELRKAKPDITEFSLLMYAVVRKFLDLTAANASRVFPSLRMLGNGGNGEKKP